MKVLLTILLVFSLSKGDEKKDLEYKGSTWSYVEACNCQCRSGETSTCSKSLGNGRRWCYIDEAVLPFCRHWQFDEEKQSYWSLDACYTPAFYQPPCLYLPTTCELRRKSDHSLIANCFIPGTEQVGLSEDCDINLPLLTAKSIQSCKCLNISTQGSHRGDEQLSCASSVSSSMLSTVSESNGLVGVMMNKANLGCQWTEQDFVWKCS